LSCHFAVQQQTIGAVSSQSINTAPSSRRRSPAYDMFAHTLPYIPLFFNLNYWEYPCSCCACIIWSWQGLCVSWRMCWSIFRKSTPLRRELPQLSVVHHIDSKGVISNQFCLYDRRDLISGDLRMVNPPCLETLSKPKIIFVPTCNFGASHTVG